MEMMIEKIFEPTVVVVSFRTVQYTYLYVQYYLSTQLSSTKK